MNETQKTEKIAAISAQHILCFAVLHVLFERQISDASRHLTTSSPSQLNDRVRCRLRCYRVECHYHFSGT